MVTGNGGFQIGNNLFAYGSYGNDNAYLGFAGNGTSTGFSNTASGYNALFSNTTGSFNTASGSYALDPNTTGSGNTASGWGSGVTTDGSNITGSNNTFLGFNTALYTGNLTNATAIGADAEAAASNAMVLGSINGVNDCGSPYCSDTLVGIGITAPTARLHIGNSGGTNFKSYLRIEGPANQGSGIPAFSVGGYGDFGIDASGTANGRFYVREDGAVTVGTDTPWPGYRLTIGQTTGGAIADTWAAYSSRRWKTNIHPLNDALGKIERLRGVSYDLKASGKHEIGVIAEEVGEVVPEVVSYEANGKDAQGVDYGRLTALLIEAVKQQQQQVAAQQRLASEQQQEIRALHRQIAAEQKQISALKQRATTLESMMTKLQQERRRVELASAK